MANQNKLIRVSALENSSPARAETCRNRTKTTNVKVGFKRSNFWRSLPVDLKFRSRHSKLVESNGKPQK